MSETKPTNPPALFDADAEQRIPFQFEKRGKLYNVAHVFAPIGDEDVLEYERGRNLRLTEADLNESDDRDAMAITGDTFKPAVALWDRLIKRVENYQDRPDWKEKIPAKHKAFAIQSAIMAGEIRPLPLVGGAEEFPLDDDDESSTIRLRVLFGGVQIDTEHVLRTPSADEMDDYRRLMSRALMVRGTRLGKQDQRIPSRALGLGQLYDRVKLRTTGYVSKVPLHHRMKVALEHFKGEEESLGN